MWNVIPRLLIGTNADAADLPALLAAGVSHIVNCAAELPDHHPGRFEYLRINLTDPDDSFRKHIPDICGFIEAGRQFGNVIVHCNGAISRSPAVVLSYLCYRGQTLHDAAEHLSTVLPTRPNEAFLYQIANQFGEVIDAATVSLLLKTLGRKSNDSVESKCQTRYAT